MAEYSAKVKKPSGSRGRFRRPQPRQFPLAGRRCCNVCRAPSV